MVARSEARHHGGYRLNYFIFLICLDPDSTIFLLLVFLALNSTHYQPEEGHCRKWFPSVFRLEQKQLESSPSTNFWTYHRRRSRLSKLLLSVRSCWLRTSDLPAFVGSTTFIAYSMAIELTKNVHSTFERKIYCITVCKYAVQFCTECVLQQDALASQSTYTLFRTLHRIKRPYIQLQNKW